MGPRCARLPAGQVGRGSCHDRGQRLSHTTVSGRDHEAGLTPAAATSTRAPRVWPCPFLWPDFASAAVVPLPSFSAAWDTSLDAELIDRKSTRLNSSHLGIS